MSVTRSALSAVLVSLALVPGIASAQSLLEVSTYGATSSYGDTMRKTTNHASAPQMKQRVTLSTAHAAKGKAVTKAAFKSGRSVKTAGGKPKATRHK